MLIIDKRSKFSDQSNLSVLRFFNAIPCYIQIQNIFLNRFGYVRPFMSNEHFANITKYAYTAKEMPYILN